MWLQHGLPILETEPVDPKLDGAFILLGCGIPVPEVAGVGILDLMGPGNLEAVAPGSGSAVTGDGKGALVPPEALVSSLIFHFILNTLHLLGHTRIKSKRFKNLGGKTSAKE